MGSNLPTKTLVDAAIGGSLNNKTVKEAKELIEVMATNNYQTQNDRIVAKKGVLELDTMQIVGSEQDNVSAVSKLDKTIGKFANGNSSEYSTAQVLKKEEKDKQFSKFLDIFKKLHINISFVEALEQMPSYAKFMKKLLSKRRIEVDERIMLMEKCSTILQKKLPPKLKDLGSFSILCTIGDITFGKNLCDLGASINLMPLSIFKKLEIGQIKPTMMTLQLVNRSIKHPCGMIEDVLIKVGKFIFLIDFVVLDMEEDSNIPLILGRSFLATKRALIGCGRWYGIFKSAKGDSDFQSVQRWGKYNLRSLFQG
ncbi:hypothetical protein L6164_023701 [Bauhinia variegata]|uniref:Uncharacterized protein n=1 Tax=Bauhinia variegata TaxID=167791 RepID=A0ACB9ML24_BAUVA|nr:hypothetical protein L6164_023701 [Bauhinia variegata]